MSIPDDVHRFAASQDGLVTRQQALASGMSAESIRHLLGRGRRWQRIVSGVYATFTGPLGPRHRVRAALLHAGPGALVTGGYACRAVGLRYVPPEAPLVMLVDATRSRTQTVLAQLRRTEIMPLPVMIDGIPVAPPERCVLDTCHGLTSLRSVRALLCESVQLGLTTPERVLEALGGACWKGAGLARRALGDAVAGCRSAPECELRDLVRSSRCSWSRCGTHRCRARPTRRSCPTPAGPQSESSWRWIQPNGTAGVISSSAPNAGGRVSRRSDGR